MFHKLVVISFLFFGIGIEGAQAQELPLFVVQGAPFTFEHQLFYNNEQHDLDFDTRGRVRSRHQAAGVSLGYSLTDTIQVALHGGTLVNPEVSNSVSTWRGHSGYFYGLEVADHIFPATEEWPGILVQVGVGSQTSFFDRQQTAGDQAPIDQKMRDLRYGGSAVATWRFKSITPYFGPRVEGSDVKWSDNRAAAGSPSHVEGHLSKHVGVVAGCSFSIFQGLELQIEGRALGETSIRASVQWLKY